MVFVSASSVPPWPAPGSCPTAGTRCAAGAGTRTLRRPRRARRIARHPETAGNSEPIHLVGRERPEKKKKNEENFKHMGLDLVVDIIFDSWPMEVYMDMTLLIKNSADNLS